MPSGVVRIVFSRALLVSGSCNIAHWLVYHSPNASPEVLAASAAAKLYSQVQIVFQSLSFELCVEDSRVGLDIHRQDPYARTLDTLPQSTEQRSEHPPPLPAPAAGPCLDCQYDIVPDRYCATTPQYPWQVQLEAQRGTRRSKAPGDAPDSS